MSWNPNDQRTLCHSDWQLICQICLFYVYCTSKLDFYILDALISNRPIIEQGVSDCLKFSTVVEHAILFISFWTSFENSFFRYIYSPYFSVENFIAISEQLNKDNLSILHLNIRSLNANIDNFRDFLASLNGNFSVIALTESWWDETANENSLLNLNNYYSVHQTRNNKKGGGICIYIRRQLEFKLRNDADILNNEIKTCSVEIINSKSRNSVVTGVCRPPKEDIKVFENYCKDFLKKKSWNSKTVVMVGDLDINSFDYDNNDNALVKHFFNLIFQSGFLPLI